jgi:hypothetical protein
MRDEREKERTRKTGLDARQDRSMPDGQGEDWLVSLAMLGCRFAVH